MSRSLPPTKQAHLPPGLGAESAPDSQVAAFPANGLGGLKKQAPEPADPISSRAVWCDAATLRPGFPSDLDRLSTSLSHLAGS